MTSVSFLSSPPDLSKPPISSKRELPKSSLSSSISELPKPAPLESPPRSRRAAPDVLLPPDPLSIEGMLEDWEIVVSKERSLPVAKKILTAPKQEGLEDWEEITPSQVDEIGKLLRGETATFQEKGRFTPNEIGTMMERNRDGAVNAFSSYIPGLPAYPYEVPGVKTHDGESVSDAIVKHFAKQAGGTPEFVQFSLGGRVPNDQKKARHICAFLKLLGDKNNAVNADIANGIIDQNRKVVLDPVALKSGSLTTFCFSDQIGNGPVSYRVEGDEVGLYKIEDFVNPEAQRQPTARYATSRTVTASPPDRDGNVDYTINRTFTRI